MSLKYALLGFLNYQPMTGYELKKFVDTSVAHFWSGELSQIYSTLKQLEADGLAEVNVEVQTDRPNRKVYSITEDGRSEFLDWLAQPAEPEVVREPLLVKVFFGAWADRDDLLRVLRSKVDEVEELIASCEAGRSMIRAFADKFGAQQDAFFWELVTDSGVSHYAAELRWLNDTIARVEHADLGALPRANMELVGALDVLEKAAVTEPDAFSSVVQEKIKRQRSPSASNGAAPNGKTRAKGRAR